jgi:hypothetical protein
MSPLLFAAFDLNPLYLVIGVLVFVCAICAGRLLSKDKDTLVHLKRECQELSKQFSDMGLPITSALLDDIAVGDFKGIRIHVRAILKTLHDADQRKAAISVMLKKQLDTHLADAQLREELFSLIAKRANVVITPIAVAAATAVGGPVAGAVTGLVLQAAPAVLAK